MPGCLKLIVVPIGLILIAGGVCSVLLFTQADSHFHDTFVAALQYAPHADLHVDRVQLRPLQRALVVTNLRVANPAAFKTGDALTIAKLTMEFEPRTVFSQTPVIKRMLVEGADVGLRYEADTGSNLRKLIDAAAGASASGAAASDIKRKFKINELRCEPGKVHLTSNMPLPPVELNLPAFALKDVGDKPVGTAEATAIFLRSILKETLTAKGLLNPIAEKLKGEVM